MTSPLLPAQRDTQNPRATIGFVIYYPFQFYVYKNIYQKLAHRAEFIIDLSNQTRPIERELLERDIVSLLQEYHASYRVLYHHEHQYKKYLKSFFARYVCLVSVWERGCMALPETAHLKKVCTTYGAGKELTMVRPSRGIYDVILAYGPHDAKMLSYLTKVEIVGNPKFDDWFNGTLDTARIEAVTRKLDPKKKTMLYLPTHGDLSSVDRFAGRLKECTAVYNVMVKMHYYLAHEESARVQALQKSGALLFDDSADLLVLLAVSDVVLSDNSSAIFDAVLADKPVLVADFWDTAFFDTHKEPRVLMNRIQGALTYSESIEQVIKRNGTVPTIRNEQELLRRLNETIAHDDQYRLKRKKLREELFSFNDGKCADRAVRAILDCIADNSVPSKPIMFHAFEAYKQLIGARPYAATWRLRDKVTLLEQAIREKVVQNKSSSIAVIFLHNATTDKNVLEPSLGSVLQQEFPSTAYTVHLVTKETKTIQKITDALMGKYQDTPAVEIISHAPTTTLGSIVQNVVAQTGADIVCFAEDSYAYPSDWLTQLWAVYEKDENVGGVGGYRLFMSDDTSGYEQYYYRELRRKLLINTRMLYPQLLYGVTNRIYGQNPAGALYAMSYRKTHLQSIPEYLNNAVHLGLYLKMMTMKDAPIAFIPISIKSLSPMTRASFLHEQYEEGVFEMLLGTYREKYFLSGKTLVGSIADAFAATVQKRSLIFGVLVLTGHMSYWVGSGKAYIAKMTSDFFFWLTDIKKTLDLKIERN